ncbi:uncharacterized protein LMH87_007959 [Akanthomyces muscarius]|uniref:Secretory lipase n=1 Tax=Akanthomyces muscarius TaxID=2231603 RepID=A0A9W8QKB2_AKAMU|nr:uncharacterized protein LMH87_007959 [Akanthomyces muscarius]KAJ4160025.1 hypothetical protein LMH87_007959 [Akanthomyces muscarius]
MRNLFRLFYFAILGLSVARQGSNFNLTAEFATANGCDDKCLETLNKANAADLDTFGRDFDFEWFLTASNFSGSSPGDLLKLQPLDPKTPGLLVKPGTTVYRIQYTSQDLDNSSVPATGFIVLPFAPVQLKKSTKNDSSAAGLFPLVAYAHGTSGVYTGCAPSNGPALYDYDSAAPFQVKDIVHSVTAARKAMGQIFTNEWMAVGHSEGGGAVWKLAESGFVKADKAYLGTVSLAAAVKIADMLGNHINFILQSGYLTLVAKVLQRFSPSYNFTMLGDIQRQRMAIADSAQPCLAAQGTISVGLSRDQIIIEKGLATDLNLLKRWQAEMAPASGGRTSAPMLVVQGLNDTAVVPQVTHESWQQACSDSNEVHLSEYAALDHSPVVIGAAAEWLAWIDARFNGEKTPGKCTQVQRLPFDGSNLIAPPGKPPE